MSSTAHPMKNVNTFYVCFLIFSKYRFVVDSILQSILINFKFKWYNGAFQFRQNSQGALSYWSYLVPQKFKELRYLTADHCRTHEFITEYFYYKLYQSQFRLSRHWRDKVITHQFDLILRMVNIRLLLLNKWSKDLQTKNNTSLVLYKQQHILKEKIRSFKLARVTIY